MTLKTTRNLVILAMDWQGYWLLSGESEHLKPDPFGNFSPIPTPKFKCFHKIQRYYEY